MPFNRLNHNVLGEIRPRFRLKTNLTPEEITSNLKEQMLVDKTVKGMVTGNYALLKIPKQFVHYWSPELQIRFEKDYKTNDTIIKCLVGPKQSVWALFTFAYIFISAVTFFGGMYGLVLSSLNKSNWFVYIIPVGLILLPVVWYLSKVGQKKGRDQMLHLISFLYHTVANKGSIERVEG